MTPPDPSAPYTIATVPGARRTIDLADGSRIELNGDTRITLDKAAPRFASLDRGEAMFHVRHDDSDPFVVMVGDDKLETEEHTSELQSLMRISYAVFCLKKKKHQNT